MRKAVVNHKFKLEAFFDSFEKKFSKEYVFEGHSHEFWEIFYVVEGHIEVTEDGNVYEMREGDFILHPPMIFHREKSLGSTPPTIINISFFGTGDDLRHLLSGVFHLGTAEMKEFLGICKSAAQFIKGEIKDEFFGQEVADHLTTFMFCLGRTYMLTQNKISSEGASVYKKLVDIMNEEVHNNVSIAQMAEKIFMSVSYVKVLFARYAGISPKTYYTTLRVNEAKKMLADGKGVREIAERMNFSTPGYFSVFFKKHTGMTPKQYINQLR